MLKKIKKKKKRFKDLIQSGNLIVSFRVYIVLLFSLNQFPHSKVWNFTWVRFQAHLKEVGKPETMPTIIVYQQSKSCRGWPSNRSSPTCLVPSKPTVSTCIAYMAFVVIWTVTSSEGTYVVSSKNLSFVMIRKGCKIILLTSQSKQLLNYKPWVNEIGKAGWVIYTVEKAEKDNWAAYKLKIVHLIQKTVMGNGRCLNSWN